MSTLLALALALPCAQLPSPPQLAPPLPDVVDLGRWFLLDHQAVHGVAQGDSLGTRFLSIGDVNADGVPDVCFACPYSSLADGSRGAVYVLFGGPALREPIDLTTLDGTRGFVVRGTTAYERLADGVDGLGDWNGDGIDDFAFGSRNLNGTGGAYVLFGASDLGAGGSLDLDQLTPAQGFALHGVEPDAHAGNSLAGLGDVNLDGWPDLVLGCWERNLDVPRWPLRHGITRVDAADFDADGDVDVALTYENWRGFETFRNDGTGAYQLLQSIPLAPDTPLAMRLVDLTGDGAAELVYALIVQGVPQLVVRTNPGNGNFLSGADTYPIAGCDVRLEAVDLDGDGALDLVLTTNTNPCSGTDEHWAQVLRNDGAGHLTSVGSISLAQKITALTCADFDQDGDVDACVLLDAQQDGQVQVLANDGSGLLTALPPLHLGGPAGTDLAAIDLAADGWPDLVEGSLRIAIRNDGAGNLALVEPIAGTHWPRKLRVTDLDGDGVEDVCGLLDQHLVAVLARADGTFRGSQRYEHFAKLQTLVVLDADGDGPDDVLVVSEVLDEMALHVGLGEGRLDGRYRGEAYVVFGGPTVGSSGAFELSDLDGTNGFVIEGPNGGARLGWACDGPGDVDGDGVPDVAVGAIQAQTVAAETGAVYVLRGGPGLGSTGVVHPAEWDGVEGFVLRADAVGHGLGCALDAGDVNGDGLADLVVGTAYGESAYVVHGAPGLGSAGWVDASTLDGNDGTRLFGSEFDKFGTVLASGADLDGDGRDDLLVGAPYSGLGKAYLVYGATLAGRAEIGVSALGPGEGTRFEAAGTDKALGLGLGWIGDADGDGAQDFVLSAPDAKQGGIRTGRAYLLYGWR